MSDALNRGLAFRILDFLLRPFRKQRESVPDSREHPRTSKVDPRFLEEPALGAGFDLSRVPTIPIPDRIGPYRILETLGEGGQSIVYLAIDDQGDSYPVALKLIRPGLETREVLSRFNHEREALARMDHPNIARVLGAGIADGDSRFDGRPYFVMEFVKGLPITEYVDNGSLSTRDRLRLFVAVCDGVQHAHQNAVIHRDLKPQNVLVTDTAEGPVPKIIDFGVAKALDQKSPATTLETMKGELLGTLHYMSPEQALGEAGAVDTRTDVYSLGALLYEMLAGRPPLDLDDVSPLRVVSTIADVEPIPLGRISTSFKGDIETISAKALAKDRARRYPTASELAADIDRHLNGEAIRARQRGTAHLVARFASRHRALVAMAAVSVTLLAVAVGYLIAANRNYLRELRDRVLLEEIHEWFVARVAGAGGDVDEERRIREEEITRIKSAVLEEPRSRPRLKLLASECSYFALWEREHGNFDAAWDLAKQTVTAFEELVDGNPDDRACQSALSTALLIAGDIGRDSEDVERSRPLYERTLEINERAYFERPSDVEGMLNYATALERFAYVFFVLKDYETALSWSERELAVLRPIDLITTNDIRTLEILASAHRRHGEIVSRLKEYRSAVQDAEAAVRFATKIVQLRPSKRHRTSLTISLSLLTIAYANAEQGTLASATFSQLLHVIGPIDPSNAHDVDTARFIAELYALLADIAFRRGEFDDARWLYERAIATSERIARSDPSLKANLRSLESYLSSMSLAEQRCGLRTLALDHERRAIGILANLVECREPLAEHVLTYAFDLVRDPFEELRDPIKALAYADYVWSLSPENPECLEVMSLAFRLNGDMAGALVFSEMALMHLAANRGDLRTEIESLANECRGTLDGALADEPTSLPAESSR
ncbi:MAG: serine/threonine protein kinase [Planctomycetes bacterium]|nr:serine/threonine protein kinase [Planctomycetota bacterium]